MNLIIPFFEECLNAKQVRRPYKRINEVNTNKPPNLIHMYFMAPIKTMNMEGKRYVVVRLMTSLSIIVFHISKRKSKAFDHFRLGTLRLYRVNSLMVIIA